MAICGSPTDRAIASSLLLPIEQPATSCYTRLSGSPAVEGCGRGHLIRRKKGGAEQRTRTNQSQDGPGGGARCLGLMYDFCLITSCLDEQQPLFQGLKFRQCRVMLRVCTGGVARVPRHIPRTHTSPHTPPPPTPPRLDPPIGEGGARVISCSL
jgi:hypothetical protein